MSFEFKKIFKFEELGSAPLIVDAVYEGGWEAKNTADEPLSKLFKGIGSGVGNSGGFRISGRAPEYRYCILFTSGEDTDWPDYLDLRTGIFTYYGDNKSAGHTVSAKKGNKLLEVSFDLVHSLDADRQKIIPFLIFEKFPTPRSNRSVRFRGLAIPGVEGHSVEEDLVAVWRSRGGERFQNYKATFSILDVIEVEKRWLCDPSDFELMPKAWRTWLDTGKARRLQAPPTLEIREEKDQMPDSNGDERLLHQIYSHFRDRANDFEPFAAEIFRMMYPDVIIDEVTRATVDGGRDAIGRMPIGPKADPVYLDFSLEAKCYAPAVGGRGGNSVRTGGTKRLISRLKHRQFGVLVTTSFVARQAYKEIREDGHPVIIVSGADIVSVLKRANYSDKDSLEKLLASF